MRPKYRYRKKPKYISLSIMERNLKKTGNTKPTSILPELQGWACPRVWQCRLAAKGGNECKALKKKFMNRLLIWLFQSHFGLLEHSLSCVSVSTMADLFWPTGCMEVTFLVEK